MSIVTQKGILRSHINNDFKVGTEVFYAPSTVSSSVWSNTEASTGQILTMMIPEIEILPFHRLYQRQPRTNFFAIGLKSLWDTAKPYMLKSIEPVFYCESTADRPFRFESLGEITHFMKVHKLKPKEYLVIHHTWLEQIHQ